MSMELNFVEIISLVAGIIGIVAFVGQVFGKRQEKKRKKEEWVKEICDSLSEVSLGMGIGQLDLVLSSIYDHVNREVGLESDLNLSLVSNDRNIEKALAKIEVQLNSSPVPKSISESFRGQLTEVLNQYKICRDDLGVIVDLCKANDFAEVKAIVERKDSRISEDLRGAIASAVSAQGDSIEFDRVGLISDIIGIRFVDSQIPDYSEMTNQLRRRMEDTVLSNSISLSLNSDRRYGRHGSPDALYEKAEEFYAQKMYKEAFEWYTKAAVLVEHQLLGGQDDEGGLPHGQNLGNAFFRLAECYENGEGCSKDPKKAADYYSEAARQGLAIAEYRLGLCYEYGLGRNRDYSHALPYYSSSAEKGYVLALFKMGQCYWQGSSRNEDRERARLLFEEAAEKGHVMAQTMLSALCYLGGDIENSMKWAKMAADNEDVDGMGYYGYLLMTGGAEESDYMPWLIKSARRGNVFSQFNLGVLCLGEENLGKYCSGFADECPETEQSSEAEKWFKMAAGPRYGDPASKYILGMFNLRKNKDMMMAESLFDEALGLGFKWAHFGLGIIKYHMVHNSEAREHFENAWKEGHPFAGDYLKEMYRSGFGVTKDPDRANYYKNSAVKLACDWFLSKSDKQLSALKQICVPPFDRQFNDDPDSDSTCQKVIDSTLMEFIRRY